MKSNFELPNADDLPDSDDTPVDEEDQNLLPNILLFSLINIWAERQDWYFGVDMGIYHDTGLNPREPVVVPEGFLSLGVERRKNGKSRRSYVTWEENNIPPILTLEMVSWCPREEYDQTMEIYRNLGVLYYVIYNPEFWQRDGHHPFEIYKLIDGQYQLQAGDPFWMPEVGLGIGRFRSPYLDGPEVGLGWFDIQGQRYLLPGEKLEQERAERLAAQRQTLGIEPES